MATNSPKPSIALATLFLLSLMPVLFQCHSPTMAQDEVAQDARQVDPTGDSGAAVAVKTRTFKFTYGAVLTNIQPGKQVNVWLPVATSNHDQDVELLDLNQATFERTTEKKYGNALIFFEAIANDQGEVPIEANYLVTRRELISATLESSDAASDKFLLPSKMVPTSSTLRKIVMAAAGQTQTDPPHKPSASHAIRVARHLYDGVDNHMKYNKPTDIKGWGKGDALWACNSKFGNCTDFHSLFISSARDLKIPSKFEIGFPIPTDADSGIVGGYHCWAKVLAGGKWLPVDISEADKHPELKDYYFGNLTADRVMFSVGRDLKLVPANAAGPVNYLVYPYAEIDGKQHREFRKAFRFENVNAAGNSN